MNHFSVRFEILEKPTAVNNKLTKIYMSQVTFLAQAEKNRTKDTS